MIFRGRDKVLVDAGGLKALAGRHAAHRYALGQPPHPARTRGHIEKGVLWTEPVDLLYPWDAFYMPTDHYMWARGSASR